MQKTITLHDKPIAYTFRKSRRARRLRLTVHLDGLVVLTSPLRASENIAERFLREKAAWLLSKIQFFGKFRERVDANPIARQLALHHGRRDYLKFKEATRVLVMERIAALNGANRGDGGAHGGGYGYTYNRISIKNQKTCWGSCSRRANLNFNYKILFLPPAIQDYIIVHELCHLREFNHSPRFWELVARAVPNHVAIRRELRGSGLRYH